MVLYSKKYMLHIAHLASAPLVAQRDDRGAPEAVGQLDLTREKRMLLEALRESRRSVSMRFDTATSDNLIRVLTLGAKALHYSGHGVENRLVFEDGYGKAHFLQSDALGALLRAGGGLATTRPASTALRFVFVSACHSQAAGEAFAAAGVPHVVAVQRKKAVSDAASCLFAHHFYLALLGGKTVRDCFDISQAAIAASPEPGIHHCQDLFTLLPEGGDHDVSIFADLERAPPGAALNDMSPRPSVNTFENPPSFFVGRAVECQQIYEHLKRGARCVTVVGRSGIGKSSVVAKVCEYATARRAFSEVYMVDLDDDDRWGAGGKISSDPTIGAVGGRERRATSGAAMLAAGGKDVYLSSKARDYDAIFSRAMVQGGEARTSLDQGDEIDPRRRTLFAIEGLGKALKRDGHALRLFLGRLVSRHGGVHILASSSGDCIGGAHLTGASEKIVTIKGLTDRSAALLLTASAPRKLSLAEVGASSVEDALTALSTCRAIRSFCGHPRAIVISAAMLRTLTVAQLESKAPEILNRACSTMDGVTGDENLLSASSRHADRDDPGDGKVADVAIEAAARENASIEAIVSEKIQQPDARAIWLDAHGGCHTAKWENLRQALRTHWHRRLGSCAPTDTDFHHIWRAHLMGEDHVDLVKFTIFFRFWETVLDTAMHLGAEFEFVYGFLGREGTSQLLADTLPGTFLIRYSDSRPGFLVIAWKNGGDSGSIRQSLIERQRSGWVVRLSDGQVHVYSTVSQMVMKVGLFKALYTKTGVREKSEVFGSGAL